MANTLILKRSSEAGKEPTSANLQVGELAVNLADRKLYSKNAAGEVILVGSGAAVDGNVGFEVKNQTGATIPKGTVLRFTGTLGASGRLLVAPFQANGTYPSQHVVGIASTEILDGGDGFAVDHGKITGLNTSAWAAGTILYASPTTAGALTSTQPGAPNNKITVAAVVHSDSVSGILEVRITLGSQLGNDELVELSGLTAGDVLVYDATDGRFENTAQSNLVAGSAAKWSTARTITLGGDLTGNVSLDGSSNVTLTATVAANSIALGTDTTGNYVADITAGSYITKSGTAGEGWSPTIAVDATSTNTASKVVARDASGNFSAGAITSTNYLVTTGSSTQASGATVQRVFSKSVAAGQLYQLCSYNDTEGTVAFDIQVSSETSGNSGTSTYHWEGGYSALVAGSYYRLLPANPGRGHGDGADTGLNSNAWEVYIYGIGGYEYGIAIAVPTGRTAKTLVVTVTETKRGMTFADLSANAVITSWTNAGNIYSTRSLLVESGISGNTLTSRVATGTAPLTVSSTTAVANLNADLLDGQHGSYYLDWTNITNKPDPVITVTLTGDVTGSGNATLTDLASGTISFATTIAANSVALGTDTTGNYVADLTQGTGISITGTAGEGWSPTVALATTGTAGTYTKVTTDAYGRVTSGTTLSATDIPGLDASKITSGTIDAARLPSYVDDVLEYTNQAAFPATGESGKIYVALDTNKTYRWSGSAYVYITSGAVDSVQAGNAITVSATTGVVTVNHADTSSVANVSSDNSGNTFIQDISLTFDTYGHVTGATVATGTASFTDTNTTYTLDGNGTTNSVNIELIAGGSGTGTDSINVVGSGATTVAWDEANQRITISSTDTNTTYSAATSSTLGLVELFSDTVQSVAANAVTATASRTYGIQVNASGQAVVNVPWTDTNTTYSAATSTTPGLVELFSDTVQTVAANAVTATASRTYGIQVNASGQAVVNVPWTDTNTTYSAGNGLTLTGTTFDVVAGSYITVAADSIAVDATSANTASKVVARDASGNFSAGTITATLSGSATSIATTNWTFSEDVDGSLVFKYGGAAKARLTTAGTFLAIDVDTDPTP